jgi:hypothetical protein
LPAATGIWCEGARRITRSQEGFANLLADFEVRRADTRPKPRAQAGAREGHRLDRAFEHPGDESTPAGMGGTEHQTLIVRQ